MSSARKQRTLCAQVVKLLRAEREARGLSMYAVAQNSGLSQQMIGYVERGLRSPSFETVLKLSEGIGVPLEDILKAARKSQTTGKSR